MQFSLVTETTRSHLLERCPLTSPSFSFNVDVQDARVKKQTCEHNIGEREGTVGGRGGNTGERGAILGREEQHWGERSNIGEREAN